MAVRPRAPRETGQASEALDRQLARLRTGAAWALEHKEHQPHAPDDLAQDRACFWHLHALVEDVARRPARPGVGPDEEDRCILDGAPEIVWAARLLADVFPGNPAVERLCRTWFTSIHRALAGPLGLGGKPGTLTAIPQPGQLDRAGSPVDPIALLTRVLSAYEELRYLAQRPGAPAREHAILGGLHQQLITQVTQEVGALLPTSSRPVDLRAAINQAVQLVLRFIRYVADRFDDLLEAGLRAVVCNPVLLLTDRLAGSAVDGTLAVASAPPDRELGPDRRDSRLYFQGLNDLTDGLRPVVWRPRAPEGRGLGDELAHYVSELVVALVEERVAEAHAQAARAQAADAPADAPAEALRQIAAIERGLPRLQRFLSEIRPSDTAQKARAQRLSSTTRKARADLEHAIAEAAQAPAAPAEAGSITRVLWLTRRAGLANGLLAVAVLLLLFGLLTVALVTTSAAAPPRAQAGTQASALAAAGPAGEPTATPGTGLATPGTGLATPGTGLATPGTGLATPAFAQAVLADATPQPPASGGSPAAPPYVTPAPPYVRWPSGSTLGSTRPAAAASPAPMPRTFVHRPAQSLEDVPGHNCIYTGHHNVCNSDGVSFKDQYLEQFQDRLGLPISESVIYKDRTGRVQFAVQYFQYGSLTYQPDNADAYQYEPGLVGRDLLYYLASQDSALAELVKRARRLDNDATTAQYFQEYGHYVGDEYGFLSYFDRHGQQRAFGNPVSEAFLLPDGTVLQYFERARFERHPDSAEVTLGNIGIEYLEQVRHEGVCHAVSGNLHECTPSPAAGQSAPAGPADGSR